MVSIVLVSHSQKLAENLRELALLMASEANVSAAGGLDDGGFGTSYEKIKKAIINSYTVDGVIVICDMGSSVMTSQMVIEDLMGEGKDKIILADCPFVEGCIKAAIDSLSYNDINAVLPTWENSLLTKN